MGVLHNQLGVKIVWSIVKFIMVRRQYREDLDKKLITFTAPQLFLQLRMEFIVFIIEKWLCLLIQFLIFIELLVVMLILFERQDGSPDIMEHLIENLGSLFVIIIYFHFFDVAVMSSE